MAEPTPDEHRSEEDLLAEIYREFREGLPGRLATLRTALERLMTEDGEEAAQLFYRTAHSLKGTAPSFDAGELVQPATDLAQIGLPWYEGAAPQPDEIEAASRGLDRLAEAVEQYTLRAQGNVSG